MKCSSENTVAWAKTCPDLSRERRFPRPQQCQFQRRRSSDQIACKGLDALRQSACNRHAVLLACIEKNSDETNILIRYDYITIVLICWLILDFRSRPQQAIQAQCGLPYNLQLGQNQTAQIDEFNPVVIFMIKS